MKYRNLYKNEDGTYNIVWFGSKGLKDRIYKTESYGNLDVDLDLILFDKTTFTFNYTGETIASGVTRNITFRLVGYDEENNSHNLYNESVSYTAPSGRTLTPRKSAVIDIDFGGYNLKTFKFRISGTTQQLTITYATDKFHTDFYNEEDKHDNYSEEQEGIKNSLIQRLAVIKGELWYNINYGLPLLDKIRNKAIIDAAIINIINSHEEVRSIKKYTSTVTDHTLTFDAIIETIYNEDIDFSSSYLY